MDRTEEPVNRTKQDAYSRLYTAWIGWKLNASKEYLIALRAYLYDWIDEIGKHLDHLARQQAQREEAETESYRTSDSICERIPHDHPVQPLQEEDVAKCAATCGTCGLSWDDGVSTSLTPTPAGRCPFEYFHEEEK